MKRFNMNMKYCVLIIIIIIIIILLFKCFISNKTKEGLVAAGAGVEGAANLNTGIYTLKGYNPTSKNNKYCAREDNRIICNREAVGPWEKFIILKNNDGTYSLKGWTGKYCASENNGIICNREALGPWEKFIILKNNDGTYSLKATNVDKYCASENNGIVCNRGAVGPWEKFLITRIGDTSGETSGETSGDTSGGRGDTCSCDDEIIKKNIKDIMSESQEKLKINIAEQTFTCVASDGRTPATCPWDK